MIRKSIYILSAVILLFTASSCSESFLDRHPGGPVSNQSGNEFIKARISSAYSMMYAQVGSSGEDDNFGHLAYLHATEMWGHDIVMFKYNFAWFSFDYKFQTRQDIYARMFYPWNFYYKMIYIANEVIHSVAEQETDQNLLDLKGQAFALRGFAYHMLAQYYSKAYLQDAYAPGVPVYTAPNEPNRGRASLEEVYQRAEQDLLKGKEMLQDFTRKHKQELDGQTISGLLARLYLTKGEWESAATQASEARAGWDVMSSEKTLDGFLDAENPAWMWAGLITEENSTNIASFHGYLSIFGDGGYGPFQQRCVFSKLYDEIPATDIRKKWFINAQMNNVPSKVKYPAPYANIKFQLDDNWTEDVPFMRVEEMVLIEAEALAHLNQNQQAAQVLSELMSKRDPSWKKTTVEVEDVLLQRRIELWGEGFSFFDLKRLQLPMNREGGNHKTDAMFNLEANDKYFVYLIPLREIQNNEFINKENQNEL
ncbi:MAG: RagB/SusD family nutrient uptake outer membrane protein [Bacteroidales bacterium]